MTLAEPVPDKAKEAVSPLYGVVDVLRRDRIAGWAIDRRDPGASLTVEIRREGQRIATVPANRRRRDLEANRFGSGLYGFSAPIDPPLMEGMEFTLSVRAVAADGTEVILQPLSRVLEPTGEQRALARLLEEVAACRALLEAQQSLAERVERAQLRMETLWPEPDPAPPAGRGLRLLSLAALALALLSLTLSVMSL
ncbi:hypothetical protein [Cereibacter johrii]|uniref:Uncharacterized protein n=1 Tax=Cereibacter johrii TaxID=445629 RepID=A0ABX5J8U0_9RHOB|nr:hypothetical protein [Cereibacter johrii]QCP86882.1 hypothetical protein EYE35_14675 [Cereibacter sphaeroides]MEA5159428.1 hypothetical protein [Cereibacter johrii]ODM41168.1 hypothetical protein A9O63_01770 [Cereibacter johrii]PTM79601.1 hypothetical protein C8J29_103706 [Cereibacter johrii]RAZ85989.1 hypothetical protein DDV93_06155 [Cereibacter johrii]